MTTAIAVYHYTRHSIQSLHKQKSKVNPYTRVISCVIIPVAIWLSVTIWQVCLSNPQKVFVILTGPIYCLTSFSFYSPKDICDSDRPHLLSDKFLFLFTQRYLSFGQAPSTVWQVSHSIHPKIFVIQTGPIYCLTSFSFYSPKDICHSDRPHLLSDKFLILFIQRYLWFRQAPSTVWQVSLSIHPKIFVTGPVYCLTSLSIYSPKDICDSDRPHLLSDKFLFLFTQRYLWLWQAPSPNGQALTLSILVILESL